MLAEELHTDADAEDGLLEVGDDLVELVLTEVCHRAFSFSLSGEDDAVGRGDEFGLVGDDRCEAQSLDCVFH